MSQEPQEFTSEQGQVMALIYNYQCIAGHPPTELEVQQYFGKLFHPRTTANIISCLEEAGFIRRSAHISRSVELIICPDNLPLLLPGRSIKINVHK